MCVLFLVQDVDGEVDRGMALLGERRWSVQEDVEEGGAADGGGIVQGEGASA